MNLKPSVKSVTFTDVIEYVLAVAQSLRMLGTKIEKFLCLPPEMRHFPTIYAYAQYMRNKWKK